MASLWQFGGDGLARGDVGSAPTYDDVLYNFMGQTAFRPGMYDPALAMTLNAGGQGGIRTGLSAFLTPQGNAFDAAGRDIEGGTQYSDEDMKQVARGLGIDAGDRTGRDLQDYLNGSSQIGDYYNIGGMSAGWNPTGDARQGNATLYRREGGKLVPVQTQGGHLREQGNYIEEHPGVLAPLGVAGAGLLAGYLGAGAMGSAGAAGGGITGTAGASGMAAYGAGATPGLFATAGTGSLGAGLAGGTGYLGAGALAGSAAYGGLGSLSGGAAAGGGGAGLAGDLQAWYSDLPGYQQQALRGAGQNFVTSGGDPRAAVRGGISGGIGGLTGDALGGGMLGNIGGRLAGGLAGGLIGGPGSAAAGASGGGEGGSSGEGFAPAVGPVTSAPPSGMTGGVGSNPLGVGLASDVRQQLLAKEMATTKRAGDVVNDNPLIRALRSA